MSEPVIRPTSESVSENHVPRVHVYGRSMHTCDRCTPQDELETQRTCALVGSAFEGLTSVAQPGGRPEHPAMTMMGDGHPSCVTQ